MMHRVGTRAAARGDFAVGQTASDPSQNIPLGGCKTDGNGGGDARRRGSALRADQQPSLS